MSSAALKSLKRKFQSLKSKLEEIVDGVTQSVEKLDSVVTELGTFYSYDGVAADYLYCEGNKNYLSNLLETLNNEVLPKINSEIRSLNIKIREVEAQENSFNNFFD